MGFAVEVVCQNTVCGSYGQPRTVPLVEPAPGVVVLPPMLCAACLMAVHHKPVSHTPDTKPATPRTPPETAREESGTKPAPPRPRTAQRARRRQE